MISTNRSKNQIHDQVISSLVGEMGVELLIRFHFCLGAPQPSGSLGFRCIGVVLVSTKPQVKLVADSGTARSKPATGNQRHPFGALLYGPPGEALRRVPGPPLERHSAAGCAHGPWQRQGAARHLNRFQGPCRVGLPLYLGSIMVKAIQSSLPSLLLGQD